MRVVLALLALLAGCAQLQPVDLPAEQAPARVDAPHWDAIDQREGGNDWFVVLNEGQMALDWRLRAIDSATESIELQTFLWSLDTTGTLVMSHLLAAAERGVRVKLLIDDSFLVGKSADTLALVEHPRIDYRVFNPYKRRSSNAVLREALNLAEFHRLDYRMHNKAMIVDGRVAIVGGRNLADEYFGLHGLANFRDMELLVGGPVVNGVIGEFMTYWNDEWSIPAGQLGHGAVKEREQAPPTPADPDLHRELSFAELREAWLSLAAQAFPGTARVLADPPPDDNLVEGTYAATRTADQLRELLDQAEQDITILSAYLIPTPALEETLAGAVERGVRVRLLTNSIRSNNHLIAHSAYRNHISNLLSSGVELHEVRIDADGRHVYMRSPVTEKSLALHAKTLVVDDDQVFVGSLNLDPRSMRINTEMGLLVESEPLNRALREKLNIDFTLENAWQLRLDENDRVTWVSNSGILTSQPSTGFMQSLSDWFFAHLPVEDEL